MESVRVEIGPVSRDSADAWFAYAANVISTLRDTGADRAPPEVLDAFEAMVDRWRSALPEDRQPFHWVGEHSDDEVGYLINALYETGLAVEAAHASGDLALRPPMADEFHYALVNQVLAALAAEGGAQSHLVEILRDHWGVARG